MSNHAMLHLVNIGSNIGHREAMIGSAILHISGALGVSVNVAPPEESESWGYKSSERYINVGIAFEADLSPLQVYHTLKEIEQSIDASPHRDSHGNYIDRRIDIDLIASDDNVIDTPVLTLPHPRMHKRLFVLRPIVSLAPRWRHPASGLTAQEMIDNLLNK